MQPLLHAVVKPELLKHQDREVKLLVAACICEITRITAPEAPYTDDILKVNERQRYHLAPTFFEWLFSTQLISILFYLLQDIFHLIVSTFSGLSETSSPFFGRRVVILETLARYKSCLVMLDLECDDLINEMFTTFLSVARCVSSKNFFGIYVFILFTFELLLASC